MASWTQIANMALRRLGAERVAIITEDSAQGRAVNDIFETVRDNVLRAHPWNCAMARAQLAATPTAPLFGYATQYTLPTDPYCLRVWKLYDGDVADESIEYKVEGRKLLTDATGALNLLFISRVTDPEQFDATLTVAIAAAIAEEIAFRLTNSRTAERQMADWAKKALQAARSADAQEGTPDDIVADYILGERSGI